jgi:hypothetical protein
MTVPVGVIEAHLIPAGVIEYQIAMTPISTRCSLASRREQDQEYKK